MVLNYTFIDEQDLIYTLMLLVDEEQRFQLDYQQILNSAKEVNDTYIIKLPSKTVRINKITCEVEN